MSKIQNNMKLKTKIKKSRKAIKTFINQTKKNFIQMKKKIKSIWVIALFITCLMGIVQSCNVTRVVTNESQYYQRGDTSVVIQTKVIETYDATKKGL